MERIIESLENAVEAVNLKENFTLGNALKVAFVSGFCIKLFKFARDVSFGALFGLSLVLILVLSPIIILALPFWITLGIGSWLNIKGFKKLGWSVIGTGTLFTCFIWMFLN